MITANIAFNGYIGLSTDTKPAALNGSRFYEMDTQKSYMYDQEGGQWIEQPASGGGGGSTGGGAIFVKMEKDEQNLEYVLDTTYADILAAIEAGQQVILDADLESYSIGLYDGYYVCTTCQTSEGNEYIWFDNPGGSTLEFNATSGYEYPTLHYGD